VGAGVSGWSTRLACCFRRPAGNTSQRLRTHAGRPNRRVFQSERRPETHARRVSAASGRRQHASRVLHPGDSVHTPQSHAQLVRGFDNQLDRHGINCHDRVRARSRTACNDSHHERMPPRLLRGAFRARWEACAGECGGGRHGLVEFAASSNEQRGRLTSFPRTPKGDPPDSGKSPRNPKGDPPGLGESRRIPKDGPPDLGESPWTPKGDPPDSGESPRSSKGDPPDSGESPWSSKGDPPDLGESPWTPKGDPRDLGESPWSSKGDPPDLGESPRTSKGDPRDLGESPWTPKGDPPDSGESPRTSKGDPRDLGESPWSSKGDPPDLGESPFPQETPLFPACPTGYHGCEQGRGRAEPLDCGSLLPLWTGRGKAPEDWRTPKLPPRSRARDGELG
jgi:hypothetical protein